MYSSKPPLPSIPAASERGPFHLVVAAATEEEAVDSSKPQLPRRPAASEGGPLNLFSCLLCFGVLIGCFIRRLSII